MNFDLINVILNLGNVLLNILFKFTYMFFNTVLNFIDETRELVFFFLEFIFVNLEHKNLDFLKLEEEVSYQESLSIEFCFVLIIKYLLICDNGVIDLRDYSNQKIKKDNKV